MVIHDQFDTTPKVKIKRLNVLPPNHEEVDEEKAVGPGRFPSWLHRKMPKGNALAQTGKVLNQKRLHTVCEEAKCPNLLECWSKKTATFLVMGKHCTRSCGFCDIDFSKQPKALELDEPQRIAESVLELGLKHVVITMVARDDLPDGGAVHLANIVTEVRRQVPGTTIELLTSDFGGNLAAWDVILNSQPEIFNHNIETVRELTPRVRHTATYDRTLDLLLYAKTYRKHPGMLVKSGIMLGLGETEEQVEASIRDLHAHGCDIITMGQYLQPNRHKLRVKDFIPPEQFKKFETFGYQLGVRYMYCGPFVRSSYNANVVIQQANQTQVISSE
ncbi:MAG: lipoyl synthase [Parachlamydiaceae bacterium]|nr:lipoyl synthase [Parachlamydiaceae bacterium]